MRAILIARYVLRRLCWRLYQRLRIVFGPHWIRRICALTCSILAGMIAFILVLGLLDHGRHVVPIPTLGSDEAVLLGLAIITIGMDIWKSRRAHLQKEWLKSSPLIRTSVLGGGIAVLEFLAFWLG